MEKKFTLNEAYQETLRIKKEMGIPEYLEKQLEREFKRGYAKAILDMQVEFQKKSNLLALLNR